MNRKLAIPDEIVISKIYLIRGHKVMIDNDLAELYNVSTKVLNQAVKRSKQRFPSDFLFQLSANEFRNLRSQTVTSSWGGRRINPYAFTEQGVAMLSSVLSSERAILVNIHIIRVFTKNEDDDIKLIFSYLKELLNPARRNLGKIGFKRKDEY